MAKINTKEGDVFMVRGYPKTKEEAAFVELETDCPVAIAQLTPREALRITDALTKAALKAQGLTK